MLKLKSKREMRARLRKVWDRVSRDDEPVAALRASKLLRLLLARWERILVAEALDAGATWEELGRALGVTRQAVWSRFRSSGR
jgi:hypothetical protein